jgi:hypothetical protein
MPELEDLIRRGVIRVERINRAVFIDLNDVECALRASEEGSCRHE